MGKKVFWGCSAFLVLVAVGLTVLVTLNWDKSGIDASGTATDFLSRDLEEEFGAQPHVEFTCILPIVGAAPCVLNKDAGSREVMLTFTNYELPKQITQEEQARRIAILSFKTSEFVQESDQTDVIFENTARSEFANTSQTSKYSFGREQLAAAVAAEMPSREAAGDGKVEE